MTVLVINSGSSSIKYQLIDVESEEAIAKGLVERIGEPDGHVRHQGPRGEATRELDLPDHEVGLRVALSLFAEVGPPLGEVEVEAVGHRVVHGGDRFSEPVVIDDQVERTIEELVPLAPLHNPANLEGIRTARRVFPDVPHVAVFDTAFHATLPPHAYAYAIDRDIAKTYGIRRYGFHGTSHAYVSREAARLIGRPVEDCRVIVLHLGNGASAAAVRNGRSVETSMGLTPLEGLVMGTRTGDIDAGVVFHLRREAGLSVDELDDLFNRKSGMLGLAGANDMREVHRLADAGDDEAALALEVYCHRLRKYVGAYFAVLGGVDAVAFTAGVGENDARVRAAALAGLDALGISVDEARNESSAREAHVISPDGSPVAVLVVPTNEELEIARQTLALAQRRNNRAR